MCFFVLFFIKCTYLILSLIFSRRLRDEYGPLNWRNGNILDVNYAVRQLGELRLLHFPTQTVLKGTIQVCFANAQRRLGRRHNHITVIELYRRSGYPLNRPQDQLIYIEHQPIEMMEVVNMQIIVF
ncbi:hypothetical protein CAEBREN_06021 [Caenorhabditis brenneri]|uniref:Uncharacterized protein n=1 Tax=Caenorhabditis brenneri TaxID=135651 RepID=G0ND07_CAEBE|nr:hypothetical protein CAEBREN_06021 [Caenorhabditis brenneri]